MNISSGHIWAFVLGGMTVFLVMGALNWAFITGARAQKESESDNENTEDNE